jgi:hypothetical protein
MASYASMPWVMQSLPSWAEPSEAKAEPRWTVANTSKKIIPRSFEKERSCSGQRFFKAPPEIEEMPQPPQDSEEIGHISRPPAQLKRSTVGRLDL